MKTYCVIQVTETGEEFCVQEFRTENLALAWLDANADNYPESSFYIEEVYPYAY